MKREGAVIAIGILLVAVLLLTGCGRSKKDTMIGTWEYRDEESGLTAVYQFREDGTGLYRMETGEEASEYEIRYELKDGHLLVRYVNNELFSEDLVFDSEYVLESKGSLIIRDSFGESMTFLRKE